MTHGLVSVQGWSLNTGSLYTGLTLFSTFKSKSREVVRLVNILQTCRLMPANRTRKGSLPDVVVGCFCCFLYFLKPLKASHKLKVSNKS